MDKKSAIKAMLEGKKVKYYSWSEGQYLRFENDGDCVDEKGRICSLNGTVNEGWEIYEEPKKKKKVKYAPILFDTKPRPSISSFLHTEEEFKYAEHAIKWLGDSDLAIEVEVEE